MKKYKVKCPICSKIDVLVNKESYKCSYCNHINNISDCEIVNLKEQNRNLEYVKQCLKKSIIANDIKKIEYYLNILALKYNKDHLYQYLLLDKEEDKLNYLLNSNIESEDLYFIIKNLLIKDKKISNENKQIVIKKFNNNEEISLLMKYISILEEDDKELIESLINEKIEVIEYKDLNKDKYIALFLIALSIILSFLITLICNLTVYDDCVYATTIVLGLLPSITLGLGFFKLAKIKNIVLKIFIFIVIFYLLTFLMTIIYHDVSFKNSFYDHLKHIVNAVSDILDSITEHADIDWTEGE